MSNDMSLLLTILIAIISAIAGYISRIEQKIENRRDDIYINELPQIYSLIYELSRSLELLLKGMPILLFIENIDNIYKNLKPQINTGHLLIYNETLHNKLLEVFDQIETSLIILREIKDLSDLNSIKDIEKNLKTSFTENTNFCYGAHGDSLVIDMKRLYSLSVDLKVDLKIEIDKYKSGSIMIILLIITIGILLGVIEILK